MKITQEKLAGDLFTKSYISHIERGSVRPSIRALEYFSQTLNKPISYFLSDLNDGMSNSEGQYYLDLIKEGEKFLDCFDFDSGRKIFSTLINKVEYLSPFHRGLTYYFWGYILFKTQNELLGRQFVNTSIETMISLLNSSDEIHTETLLDIYIKIAEGHYILNNKETTVEYFYKALNIEDVKKIDKQKYIYILRCLAIIYVHQGAYPMAIDLLIKLINFSKENRFIDENVISGYFTLATCYDSTSRLDDSLGIFEKILPILCLMEDHKRLAKTYYKISDIYVKQCKYEDAILYISKSLKFCEMIKEIDIKNVTRLHNQLLLANISFKKNNLNQALNQTILVIEGAKATQKTDNETISLLAWSHLTLGEIYCEMEAYENAQKAIVESISHLENCKVLSRLPGAYRLLGVICTKLNQPEKALKQYEKAYSLLAKIEN